MKQYKSLQLTLFLPILIASAFLSMMGFSSVWQGSAHFTTLESKVRMHLKNLTLGYQRRLETLLQNGEKGSAQENLHEFASLSDIAFAFVVDAQGEILLGVPKKWVGKSIFEIVETNSVSSFESSFETGQFQTIIPEKSKDLVGFIPLVFAVESGQIRPSLKGMLVVSYNLTYEKAQIWSELALLFLVNLIGAIVFIVITNVILRWKLTNPLIYLNEKLKRIEEGNLEDFEAIKGEGELYELSGQIQRMLIRIRATTIELRVKEENLAITLNSIGEGVLVCNLQGQVTNMNPVAESLTGWKLEETFGISAEKIFKIADAQKGNYLPNPIYTVLNNGTELEHSNHICLVTKAGKFIPIANNASPIRDNEGNTTGVVMVFRDVSGLYVQNKRIAEMESELRNITNNLPGPVGHLDATRRFTYVSSLFLNWFGVSQKVVLGLTPKDVLPPHLCNELFDLLNKGYSGVQASCECCLVTGSRKPLTALVTAIPEFDKNNGVIGCFLIFFDISSRKLAEDEARKLKDQLHQASKMEALGQMTAGIAHDFNNMLGAIMGYAELSQLKIATGKFDTVEHYLGSILSSGERAKELISQMLTFSRVSLMQDETPSISLLEPMEGALNLLRNSIQGTIELKFDRKDASVSAKIQPVKLQQILLNLGINAKDSMGSYGVIEFELFDYESVSKESCTSCKVPIYGKYAVIRVNDEGSGIPEEYLEKIFDPFFTTKELGKGTGMGLSVVHGIVHSLGGHLLVKPRPKGTSFTIFLPSIELTKAVVVSKFISDPILANELLGLRVFILGDEPDLAHILEESLKMYGAQVQFFTSSLEALSVLSDNPQGWDILITDENMPGLSGLDLVTQVKTKGVTCPIIMCTGYSSRITVNTAKDFGLAGFFAKPFSINDIVKTIKDLTKEPLK